MKSAGEILQAAAETHAKKGAEYGDSLKRYIEAMRMIFPQGVTLETPKDFNRFHFFSLIMAKVCRYASNWEGGGHQDSIHDIVVYAAMLESEDAAGN